MIDSIKLFISELRQLWARIGLNQKIGLGILLTLLISALFFWGSWNARDDFGLLFKNLRQKHAGEIVNLLKADGVPHRLEDGGTTILVPSEQVYELRLKLATQGLPGQDEGWALFDRGRLGGLSDFVRQVNYTRALQAELERTISRLRQVEWARVHIVEARDSLFVDKTQPATASVLIRTRAGAHLSDSQISGITHLISGAVRGLLAENVTITDYSGRQLSRPAGSDAASLASNQLDYCRRIEEHLSSRATQMLERVVGPGKAVVTVSAQIDFSSSESHKIEYKEDITKRKTETISETTAAGGGGKPGVQANLAGETGGSSTLTSTRQEETEFLPPVPAAETKRVEPAGSIKRLAAAVFVSAGEYRTTTGSDGQERREYMPVKGAKLAEYEKIVKNAIGFVDERDAITISDGEFKSAAPMPPEELETIQTENTRQFIVSLVKSGSTALGVLLFLFFARRVLKKAFAEKALPPAQTGTVGADNTVAMPKAGPQADETVTRPLREKVTAAVSEDPDKATQHLRTWLNK